jgi:hypothetical protein
MSNFLGSQQQGNLVSFTGTREYITVTQDGINWTNHSIPLPFSAQYHSMHCLGILVCYILLLISFADNELWITDNNTAVATNDFVNWKTVNMPEGYVAQMLDIEYNDIVAFLHGYRDTDTDVVRIHSFQSFQFY